MCQGCSGIKELIIDHIKNEEKTLTASQVDCLSWIWIVLNFLWMIFTWMILESCCWIHEKCVHECSFKDCWWRPCVLSPSVWLAECATALSEGSSHGSWTLDNPGTRRVISYPLTNIWGPTNLVVLFQLLVVDVPDLAELGLVVAVLYWCLWREGWGWGRP